MTNRELDKQIAEHIFGWRNFHQERHGDEYVWCGEPPNCGEDVVDVCHCCSANPTEATFLREALFERGAKVRIEGSFTGGDYAWVRHQDEEGPGAYDAWGIWGDSWMQALCWAALIHVGALTREAYTEALAANQQVPLDSRTVVC